MRNSLHGAQFIELILPTTKTEIVDTEYIEIDSVLCKPVIDISTGEKIDNWDGRIEMWKALCNLQNGEHCVEFSATHEGQNLDYWIRVWMDDSGMWMYDDFVAIDEEGNEYEVIFDAKYYNKYYLN